MTLGDFDTSTVVYGKFTTYRPSTGAPFTLAGTPALSVYKDNSTTQSTTGVTLTADFDSVTGLNHFAIDTSADGAFYAAGSFFDVVITTGTVDSVSAVGSVVARFTLRKTSDLKPTTAGRTLDVTATGAAGIDWANVENPTTTLNLSGTTVKTATDVETDTADIQSRLPAALVGGRIDANVGAISGDSVAADNLEAAADGTGYNLGGGSVVAASVTGAVGSVTGAVGSVTGNVGGNVTGSVGSVATGGITAASIATGAIDADALATDAVAEIADGVWDEALSGHLTAGSTGNALNAAGSAGDPWSTSLPGAYGAGTAGFIVGTNLDATVSSRAAAATALSTATWTGTRAGYLDNLSSGAVALASGVNVTQISGDSVAADNLEAMLDGTGGVTLTTAISGNITGNLSGSVGSVSGAVGSVTGNVGGNVAGSVGSVGTGGIAAASFAANSITASALAADAVSEIQSGLSTLDAGGVRTAVGLASANLDTQIATLATASALSTVAGNVTSILDDTGTSGVVVAAGSKTGYALTSAYDFATGTTAVTESYAANGAAPTPVQAILAIHQMLMQFAIAGTALTVKRLDNTTTAFTVTLNDGVSPTGAART